MKIGIGLPTNRLIKPKTAQSLLKLVNQTEHELEIIVSTKGYNCAENRNWIAAQAVKKGCTHLFHVDDDMIYEPDTLEMLLLADKDIVGGLYKTKYEEVQDYVIKYLHEIKEHDRMFECSALGTGLLLVKIEVFKKTLQPWYGYEWYSNGMVKESVDWVFCHNARKAGFKVWCDPDVKAKHIGLKEY
jgi:hypothetical protein